MFYKKEEKQSCKHEGEEKLSKGGMRTNEREAGIEERKKVELSQQEGKINENWRKGRNEYNISLQSAFDAQRKILVLSEVHYLP